MEFCTSDLKALLNEFKETRRELIKDDDLKHIFDQIASGTAHLHGKDIIHRDIKPANVLLKLDFMRTKNKFDHIQDMTFKIADFGFSRELQFIEETEVSKSMVGNMKYSSPEVASIKGAGDKIGSYAGKPADVFSLGAMFYELATFKVPFDLNQLMNCEKKDIDLDETLKQIVCDDLRAYLKQFLEWDPNDRIVLKLVILNLKSVLFYHMLYRCYIAILCFPDFRTPNLST